MNEAGEERDEVDGSDGTADAEAIVRGYYEAIDAKNYDRFADLLAPEVVHERPDRTIESRETLVRFMREDRPQKDTSHEIDGVYRKSGGGGDDGCRGGDSDDGSGGKDYAVRGRLLDADGDPTFEFVDVFEVGSANEAGTNGITRIRTYTR